MKKNIILFFLIGVLMFALWFMAKDFLRSKPQSSDMESNPFEYDIDEFKQIAEDQICYSEMAKIDVHLSNIFALTLDSEDNIYVSGTDSILVFSSGGQLLLSKNVGAKAKCLHFSEFDGALYAGFDNYVARFDKKMQKTSQWQVIEGNAVITSIATNENFVYVADAGNKQVLKYDKSGTVLQTIKADEPERQVKGFIIPSGYFDLAFDSNGSLWVVNPGMHRFENIGNDGKLRSSWENSSMGLDGFSGCCNPSHFAFLSDGSYVTSEKGLVRIKIHQADGKYKCVVAAPKQFDEGTVGIDIAVDSQQHIVVLDPKRLQIRIFASK